MDLVTFGEAMLRLTPPAPQRLQQAESLDVYVGGSELNVAVLAARLGVRARWVSRLPDNALGRLIASRAREQGVDAQVEWAASTRAGLYFVEFGTTLRAGNVLYDRAGSAITRVTPGSIDWAAAFAGARWYHVSGITPALSSDAANVTAESLAAAKQAGLTVSYDLNYRSKLWSPQQACAAQEALLEHVDVLIAAAEDARVVFGIEGETDEVARALAQRFGIGVVAVTLRDNPQSAVTLADGQIHIAARHEVDSVDRIGAGDAFAGGLIVSRLEQRGWDEAMRFATATAALKHTIRGDFCLISRQEVEQLLGGSGLRASR